MYLFDFGGVSLGHSFTGENSFYLPVMWGAEQRRSVDVAGVTSGMGVVGRGNSWFS